MYIPYIWHSSLKFPWNILHVLVATMFKNFDMKVFKMKKNFELT